MRLSEVNMQAYRSLYNVSLQPRDFTVLVGPNNAGKTNLADGLDFLGQIARNGLEVAVGRAGGFENLAFRRRRRTRRPVRFSFRAEIPQADVARGYSRRSSASDDRTLVVDYSFELRANSESRDADFRVSAERLQLVLSADHPVIINLSRDDDDVSFDVRSQSTDPTLEFLIDPFDEKSFRDYVERRIDPTVLALNTLAFNPVITELLARLGQTRLFQLTPVECRKPGSSTPSPELGRHGDNLPGVIRYMQRNHKQAWTSTLRAMQSVVPGLTSIETAFTTGRRLTLLFHETGARAWTAEEVSDGTIQCLALFTALFDPRIPFVLIEEPENSVHPWIVKTFVDACRDAPLKQILVTTHSPALIGYLYPDELEIATRDDDGRTHICPLIELDPQVPSLWAEGKIDLYELIDGGWIREAVPGGLQ